MSTEVLGSLTFIDNPSAAGQSVVLNTGVPVLVADTAANRPTAGSIGRLFVDTTNLVIERDNGTTWDTLGSSGTYTGTANQIGVAGTVISIASNPIIPGNGGMVIPTGTTAQRGSTTAGNVRWNSTLGYEEVYNGAVWKPVGRLLQRVVVAVPSSSGTNTFTLGTTLPTTATMTSTVATQSFTPLSASSTLLVRFASVGGVANNSRGVLVSVFADTTHIISSHTYCASSNFPYPMVIESTWQPGSTAAISITLRAAATNGATTWSVGAGGSVTLGGGFASDMIIEEWL